MTPDDDKDLDDQIRDDFDGEQPEDFEKESEGGRPSLKDLWRTSPPFKIAAIAVGVVVVALGVHSVFGDKAKEEDKSIVRVAGSDSVKAAPGQEAGDAEYNKAVEEQNRQRAQEAISTGTSAMPTPIGAPKAADIEVPAAPIMNDDPLKEWRAKTEAKRVVAEAPPAPDLIKLRFAESAQAMLVDSNTLKSTGLIYCGPLK